MNRSRRNYLRRMLLLGLLPGFFACSSQQKLTVASHVWPGYEFMFMARDEGWLSAEVVSLLETQTASESIARLLSGEALAAALTLDEVLLARAKGLQLTVVLIFDVSAGADKVIARKPLRQLADLKGQRIAVETSAVGSLMLHKLLHEAGLSTQDIKIVEMSGNHADMWKSDSSDVLITYDPTATQLLAAGGVSIFDSRQMPEMIFDVLAVRNDVLPAQSDTLKSLIAAHFRGLSALRNNPSDTVFRLAKHLGVAGNDVMSSYRGLKLPDTSANQKYLRDMDSPLHAAARQLSELMLASGVLPKTDSLKQLFSAEYLPT